MFILGNKKAPLALVNHYKNGKIFCDNNIKSFFGFYTFSVINVSTKIVLGKFY